MSTSLIGLPKRVLELATEEELARHIEIAKKSRDIRAKMDSCFGHGNWHHMNQAQKQEWRTASRKYDALRNALTAFRKYLRNKRNGTFDHGVYTVRASSVYFKKAGIAMGLTHHWTRLEKNEILIFVERDNLNRPWFLRKNNEVITVLGACQDGIEKIKK